MKRLIMYTSPYEEIEFSDCSTKYEVLPFVVDDNASSKDLRELAIILGFKPIGRVKSLEVKTRSLQITHSLAVGETKRLDYYGRPDTRRPIETTRLGFITIGEVELSRCGLDVNVECEGVLSQDDAHEILNNQAFDFRDFIDLNDETYLLIDSWRAFHELNVLGYSLNQFMELYECKNTVFSDSVTDCSQCGKWMDNDNGYTYNYRIVNHELLGIECGCYAEYMEKNWEDRINDTETPIELDVAKKLEKSGVLKHLERFIGGMTDGHGGYYAGQSTREGTPDAVLEEYQAKHPNSEFIFTHDESGQFQTYFSIWQVNSNQEES